MIRKSTSLTIAEKFSDKKAQKIIVNLIGSGILVNRYQSGSQSRELDRSEVVGAWLGDYKSAVEV